jgi:hypothetical protein
MYKFYTVQTNFRCIVTIPNYGQWIAILCIIGRLLCGYIMWVCYFNHYYSISHLLHSLYCVFL